MSEFEQRLNELQSRLGSLMNAQDKFQREINEIRAEMNLLRKSMPKQTPRPKQETPKQEIPKQQTTKERVPPPRQTQETKQEEPKQRQTKTSGSADYKKPPPIQPNFSYKAESKLDQAEKSNIERFIGENLISKIGIVILVIGVAIGAKYAIDNNLISPLMRIVLGYAMGIGLVGLAVRLKPKYLNFSAVLLSGGMAIMYFITFFAYSLYSLINQPTAFVLMVLFTVFRASTVPLVSWAISMLAISSFRGDLR